eukprot:g1976.t1
MADASAPADAGPPSGPSQPLDRIDELSDELIRRVQERRGRLREERQKMTLEFEAKRVQLHTEYSTRLLQADEE